MAPHSAGLFLEEVLEINLGRTDRFLRLIATGVLGGCAFAAPIPLLARLIVFALPAGYLLLSAALGTCLGYRILGRSTCPTPRRMNAP
jgi:hypothetical protein